MTYNTVHRHDPSKGLSEKNAGAIASPTVGEDRIVLADSENSNQGVYAEARNVQTRDISGKSANERTGFPLGDNGTDANSQLIWDDASRTLTISFVAFPPGNFKVWCEDVEFTKTTETVTITDTEGLWYFYYTVSGVLTATQTFSDQLILGPRVFVAYGYWDATNKKMLLGGVFDERHGMQMDGASHLHWHEYVGATYRSGLSLNNLLVDQGPPVNDNTYAQFGADSGVFNDEDLRFTADAVLSTTGLTVLYLSGATPLLREITQAGYSIITDVTAGIGATGRLVYNQNVAGTYQLTVVPDNDFVLCHVFVTGANTSAQRIYSVMGQNTYGNKNDAEEGANTELANLRQVLPIAEILPIATVIFQTSSTYTNAVKARVVSTDSGDDYVDWRFSGVAQGTGASPANHNLLSNRSDPNSHPSSAITVDEANLDKYLAAVVAAADPDLQDFLDELDDKGLQGAGTNWRFDGALTPAQLTADVDDYAPAGYAAVSILRLDSDAQRTITGLVPSSAAGHFYFLENIGSNNIVLSNEDASSTAANRFQLTADFTLEPGALCIIKYDPTSSRWRLVGGGGGAASTDGSVRLMSLVRCTKNDTTSVATGTDVVVDFDSVTYDDDGTVTTGDANWAFTAPHDGYYRIHAFFEWVASSDWDAGERSLCKVQKYSSGVWSNLTDYSNSYYEQMQTSPSSWQRADPSLPVTVYLAMGEKLRIVVNHNSAATQTINSNGFLEIVEIPTTLSNLGQPDLYSETETKLPGQWWQDPNSLTDYYPYYVKKVDLGAGPNAASKSVVHGISNFHSDSIESYLQATDGSFHYTINYNSVVAGSENLLLSNVNATWTTVVNRTTFVGTAYIKYAKTTDTPVTRDEAYGNGGAGFDDYSTSETVTNKRWLGATVYRKVVALANKPNAGSANNAHGIAALSEVIGLMINFQDSSGNLWSIVSHSVTGTTGDEYAIADATNIVWTSGLNRTTAINAYAVIEYTKP